MLSAITFILRATALGLWVGAMAGFAFLFAPTAFHEIGPTPAFAATIAASVRAITTLGYVLGLIAVACTIPAAESQRRKIAIYASVALAFIASAIETKSIVPQMEKTPLLTAAYESLHRQSSGVYSAVLLFALVALILCLSSRSPYRSA